MTERDIYRELRLARSDWSLALEAIMTAWKSTPTELLGQRMVVRKGVPDQTLAHDAVKHLIGRINDCLSAIGGNTYARENDLGWGLSDLESVMSVVDP